MTGSEPTAGAAIGTSQRVDDLPAPSPWTPEPPGRHLPGTERQQPSDGASRHAEEQPAPSQRPDPHAIHGDVTAKGRTAGVDAEESRDDAMRREQGEVRLPGSRSLRELPPSTTSQPTGRQAIPEAALRAALGEATATVGQAGFPVRRTGRIPVSAEALAARILEINRTAAPRSDGVPTPAGQDDRTANQAALLMPGAGHARAHDPGDQRPGQTQPARPVSQHPDSLGVTPADTGAALAAEPMAAAKPDPPAHAGVRGSDRIEGGETSLGSSIDDEGVDPDLDGTWETPSASAHTDGEGRRARVTMSAADKARGSGRTPDSSLPPEGVGNVSRETRDHGTMPEHVGELSQDAANLEDEAVVAVREAALRAAAEVQAERSDDQDGPAQPAREHVSRETERASRAAPADQRAATSGDKSHAAPHDRAAAARNARVTFRVREDLQSGSRRVFAVANQKGGVGKSTTTVNLGTYLALAGARVLIVDLDPQGNASTGLGLDHRRLENSIYEVLMDDVPATTAIRPTSIANLDVLPSTIDLAGAEVELVSALSRESRLRRALESLGDSHDVVFVDCPPSLGLLTVNALAAADDLLIPIQCEYYALEGLGQLLRNVDLVRVNLNPRLRVGGIVLTMYDGRTRLAEQVVAEVRRHFVELVYRTVVPRSVRLSEAPGYGVPIALYDPLSRGGIAYRDLAFELAERTGLLAPTEEGAN
jgi:chromosome partitioning protein